MGWLGKLSDHLGNGLLGYVVVAASGVSAGMFFHDSLDEYAWDAGAENENEIVADLQSDIEKYSSLEKEYDTSIAPIEDALRLEHLKRELSELENGPWDLESVEQRDYVWNTHVLSRKHDQLTEDIVQEQMTPLKTALYDKLLLGEGGSEKKFQELGTAFEKATDMDLPLEYSAMLQECQLDNPAEDYLDQKSDVRTKAISECMAIDEGLESIQGVFGGLGVFFGSVLGVAALSVFLKVADEQLAQRPKKAKKKDLKPN